MKCLFPLTRGHDLVVKHLPYSKRSMAYVSSGLVGIALVLLFSTTPVEGESKVNRDYYNPGTSADQQADWKNAHHYHLQPAFDAMKRGDWKSAHENFEFILRVFPNSPQALNGISELCVLKWRSPFCDADSWFEQAVAVNPDIATTWVIYGIHLQRERHPLQAIEKLQHALKLRPDDLNAHYNLGLAYFDLKDYDKANEQAQKSYALGAQLPGLRDKLKRAGAWRPETTAMDANREMRANGSVVR